MNYEYRCISAHAHFASGGNVGKLAAVEMKKAIDAQMQDGFEFYGTHMVGTTESPGCLGALFGARVIYREIPIMVFRKATS